MLPTNRSTRKRTKAIEPKQRKDFVGIAALVMSVIFGCGGLYLAYEQRELSIKQDSTSVTLNEFRDLLKKSDSTIEVLNTQLEHSRTVQKEANTIYRNSQIGAMNRLQNTNFQIRESFINLIGKRSYNTVSEIKDYCNELLILKSLFVSEMGNDYLNNCDSIVEMWSMTYSYLTEFNRQLELSIQYVGQNSYNLATGETEVIQLDTNRVKNYMIRFAVDGSASVIATTGFVYEKIIKDKVRLGLLDKKGEYKINPEDFFIKVDKVVLKSTNK